MVAVVVVLGLCSAALAVLLVITWRARAQGQARLDALVSDLEARDGELAATAEELAKVTRELGESQRDREALRAGLAAERERSAQQVARAERAEADASNERVDREAATHRAEEAEASLARFRRSLDPPGLWAFERQRLCRVWRDWVSVRLDDPCPLDAEPAAALVDAVGILASASREECGVPIELCWEVAPTELARLRVEEVLVVLRAAEELIAAARGSDGATLTIGHRGASLVLGLAAEEEVAVPAGLAEASGSVGWQLLVDGSRFELELPASRPQRVP